MYIRTIKANYKKTLRKYIIAVLKSNTREKRIHNARNQGRHARLQTEKDIDVAW